MPAGHHNGVEQALVFLPQSGAIAQSVTTESPGQPDWVRRRPGANQPPPCLAPAGVGVAVTADTST